jgi:hypothetical protein
MDSPLPTRTLCMKISSLLPMLLMAVASIAGANAGDSASFVTEHFTRLEKDLADLADQPQMEGTVDEARPIVRKFIQSRPEIVSLMRVNSKGKVVNEIVRNGKAGTLYRDISKQEWYRHTLRIASFHGLSTTESNRMALLWSKPIRTSKDGKVGFGGAVLATIDLMAGFTRIAGANNRPYEVTRNSASIYSFNWIPGITATATKAEIKGLGEIVINTPMPSAPAPGTAKSPSRSAGKPAGDVPNKSGLIAVVIAIGAFSFVLATLIWFRSRLRHRAILEAPIPESKTVFEDNHTVMVPRETVLGFDGTSSFSAENLKEPLIDEQWQGNMGDTFISQETVMIHRPQPAAILSETNFSPQPHNHAPQPSLVEQAAGQNPSYQQIRAEIEAEYQLKLNAMLKEQCDILRKELYQQIRYSFVKGMQNCGAALNDQMEKISQLIARTGVPEQIRAQALQRILIDLSRIRDALHNQS